MEADTSIDVVLLQQAAAKRAKALTILEKIRPMSPVTQVIVLLFGFLAVLLVAYTSYFTPSTQSAPYMALLLVTSISIVATNAIRTQRRLEALIQLVTEDL